MRIAVSGTHCVGKTTLIEEFLRAHPDFAHEPEPYTVLVDDYGEEFSAQPCAADFLRQLEFNVDRLQRYTREDRVVFERSPVDFFAYLLALKDLRMDVVDSELVTTAQAQTSAATRNLDLIVFLPLDDTEGIEIPAEEFPKLRKAVDSRLVSIFVDDEMDLFGSGGPTVVEARGKTSRRLRLIEDAAGLAGQ